MKRILFLMLVVLLMPLHATDSAPEFNSPFTKEVQAALTEIQTIKPGQTRKELLKIFFQDGGLSQPEDERYVYRKCPCIKVDVHFDSGGKILTISKPYLEFLITD